MNSDVLKLVQLELTVKIKHASIVHLNVLLVLVLLLLVLPAQMDSTCLKENALLNVQFHW